MIGKIGQGSARKKYSVFFFFTLTKGLINYKMFTNVTYKNKCKKGGKANDADGEYSETA